MISGKRLPNVMHSAGRMKIDKFQYVGCRMQVAGAGQNQQVVLCNIDGFWFGAKK